MTNTNADDPRPGTAPDRDDAPGGPPDDRPRGRGWREGDPAADTVAPGREFGAGGQVDDGPASGGSS